MTGKTQAKVMLSCPNPQNSADPEEYHDILDTPR